MIIQKTPNPATSNHQLKVNRLQPQKLDQASAPSVFQSGEWPLGYHPAHTFGGQRRFSQKPSKDPAVVSDAEVVASEKLGTASERKVVPSEGSVASALPASQPESIAEEGASHTPQTSHTVDSSLSSKIEDVSPSFVKEVQSQGEQAVNLDAEQAEVGVSGVGSSHSPEFEVGGQTPGFQSNTRLDPSAGTSASETSPKHGPSAPEESSNEPPKQSPPLEAMQSEPTTPPSDLPCSLPPPAASDLADSDLSQEAVDIAPAKPSLDLNQDNSSQEERTNVPRKSKKRQRAGGGSKADLDQPVGRRSIANVTETPGGETVSRGRRGRQQSSGDAQRQTRAESWPRAAQHLLAPVKYLTSRYGNLEITHPRYAVFAPDLDTRPEGFEFTGFEVVFFGTSSNVPSLWRNMSCTAVRIGEGVCSVLLPLRSLS